MAITQAIQLNPIILMYFLHSRHVHWQVVRVFLAGCRCFFRVEFIFKYC